MQEWELPALVTPFRFGCVEDGLYRGAYPTLKNWRFLRRLQLRSIVTLSADAPTKDLREFCQNENIRLWHWHADKFEDVPTLAPSTIASILFCLLDQRNQPLFIHCRDGGHNTGLVIMCLRRLQNWNLSVIFSEFCRYVKGSEIRLSESQYVESFKAEITLPSELPYWLWGGRRITRHPYLRLRYIDAASMNGTARVASSRPGPVPSRVPTPGDTSSWNASSMITCATTAAAATTAVVEGSPSSSATATEPRMPGASASSTVPSPGAAALIATSSASAPFDQPGRSRGQQDAQAALERTPLPPRTITTTTTTTPAAAAEEEGAEEEEEEEAYPATSTDIQLQPGSVRANDASDALWFAATSTPVDTEPGHEAPQRALQPADLVGLSVPNTILLDNALQWSQMQGALQRALRPTEWDYILDGLVFGNRCADVFVDLVDSTSLRRLLRLPRLRTRDMEERERDDLTPRLSAKATPSRRHVLRTRAWRTLMPDSSHLDASSRGQSHLIEALALDQMG